MFGIIFLTVELKGKFGDKVVITANWIPDSIFDAFHASFNVDVQEKDRDAAAGTESTTNARSTILARPAAR